MPPEAGPTKLASWAMRTPGPSPARMNGQPTDTDAAASVHARDAGRTDAGGHGDDDVRGRVDDPSSPDPGRTGRTGRTAGAPGRPGGRRGHAAVDLAGPRA